MCKRTMYVHEFSCFYGNNAHVPTVVPRPFSSPTLKRPGNEAIYMYTCAAHLLTKMTCPKRWFLERDEDTSVMIETAEEPLRKANATKPLLKNIHSLPCTLTHLLYLCYCTICTLKGSGRAPNLLSCNFSDFRVHYCDGYSSNRDRKWSGSDASSSATKSFAR